MWILRSSSFLEPTRVRRMSLCDCALTDDKHTTTGRINQVDVKGDQAGRFVVPSADIHPST